MMRINREAPADAATSAEAGTEKAAGGCTIPSSAFYHPRSGCARIFSTMDIFDEIKNSVPTREAAEFYGFHPNRAGFICCPLHGEKTPSMKLYPGSGGFHCFGCGVGGSVIDFTAQLFGLDPMGAVRRLDQDFHLDLPLNRPPSRKERKQAQRRREIADTRRLFENWRERTLLNLNTSYRVGYFALKDKHPDAWTDTEVLAVKWMPALEYWSDMLDYGAMGEQMQLFRYRGGWSGYAVGF